MIECSTCDRWFANGTAYEQHRSNSSRHWTWCRTCEREFVSAESRRQHWEDSEIHLYTYCDECEWDYPEGLNNHERHSHPERYCKQCDRVFETEVGRISHTAAKHKDSFCTDCQLPFDNADGLKLHWRSHEKHIGTYDFICDLRFPNKKTRTEHLNADPIKHFVCVQHQQFCGSRSALDAHYLKAHAKCEFCNTGFEK